MSFVNYMTREVNFKFVYYGPSLGGKTTNLHYIHHRVSPEGRGKLISLATEIDRTLLFDFVPQSLTIRGFKVRLHLYTKPGAVLSELGHGYTKLFKGCDGVVFVADSQASRREANVKSLKELGFNLEFHGIQAENLPLVFQYNKRDLPDALSLAQMEEELNPRQLPSLAATALKGEEVFNTIKVCTKLALEQFKATHWGGAAEGEPQPHRWATTGDVDDERRVILARRAKLLVASLAGLGLGAVDCGRDPKSNAPAMPDPPASSTPIATAALPVASAPDAGGPQSEDKDTSAEASADAGPDAQASASPSPSSKEPPPPPKKAHPPPKKPQPQVCLSPYDIVGTLEAEEQWRKNK